VWRRKVMVRMAETGEAVVATGREERDHVVVCHDLDAVASRKRRARSQRLLDALRPFREIVVVTHNTPDPDAIASGWGIRELARCRLGVTPRLVAGGRVLRAENRHMMRLLGPPVEFEEHLSVPESAAIVFVDCQPASRNHLLATRAPARFAVVDHHRTVRNRGAARAQFRDRRGTVAATGTLVASYLREQGVDPSVQLATALAYAIRSETKGAETRHTRLDRSIVRWLSRRADPAWIAEIENAPLPREYFADLSLALQSTFAYGNSALCLLPRASGPEIVAEVADLLVRGDAIRRVLCAAAVNHHAVVSVRTELPGDDASRLIDVALKGIGHYGGHSHRAAGTVPLRRDAEHIPEVLEEELRARWLVACGVEQRRGIRLVPRREIVSSLS
jgi:nanoRNase/pAp phosphatase (c-di-AMP/oligoRNAs hydrolase)